jgi:hypothetical protein
VRYSLVVPYYRTPDVTRICLYSIYRMARGEPEVIVVDNAPGGAESAMLREFPQVRLIENRSGVRGSAANFEALELGLARSSHDLVGLLHSDVVFLKEGWDLKCFSHLEKHKLAALGTLERESNPFRPLRKQVRDRWAHLRHEKRPAPGAGGKLMIHFLLTRKSALARAGFEFVRDRDITVSHFERAGLAVELLSGVAMGRLLWHTSNVTGLLTGQIDDPKLAATYREKWSRFLGSPKVRKLFGPVLPKAPR